MRIFSRGEENDEGGALLVGFLAACLMGLIAIPFATFLYSAPEAKAAVTYYAQGAARVAASTVAYKDLPDGRNIAYVDIPAATVAAQNFYNNNRSVVRHIGGMPVLYFDKPVKSIVVECAGYALPEDGGECNAVAVDVVDYYRGGMMSRWIAEMLNSEVTWRGYAVLTGNEDRLD